MNTLTKSFFALTDMLPLAGLGQCETCEPDLSCVAVDFPVLCPEQLPNGTQGEPYSPLRRSTCHHLWSTLDRDLKQRC